MMHRKSVYLLVLAVAAMLVLGIVMLFSTSAFARDSHGDPNYFVRKQSMWLVIGVCACIFCSLMDYHYWQRMWWVLFAVVIVLLVLCFVPPVGMKINGSWRWLDFKIITFQPSELAKLAVVVFLAHWFSQNAHRVKELFTGFIIPIMFVGLMMALIACEVDLGTTALIGGTLFIVMFIAGSSLLYIGPLALSGIAGILFAAMHMKERLGRLMAFMDLEKYKETAGMQQWQALIAFGSGGIEGLGLGNGRQKQGYLPFAHTDFILPMIGEELGLVFTLLIVFLYLVIILCGTMIALQSKDRFGMLLGCGITVIIALQAAVNIGVTTSLLPNKGLPLPFISYGGSNLVFCLIGIGILINIYSQGVSVETDKTITRLQAKTTPRI